MPILVNASGTEAELPFAIYDNDGVPQTGYSFTLGDVQVRAPGDVAFSDVATSDIYECGHGQYVVRLSAAQTADEGAVLVYFSDGANRDFAGYEMVCTGTDEVLEIPFAIYAGTDTVLDGVEGYSFTTGDVEIRLPGQTSFSNATVANIVEYGLGQYALVLTELERADPGAIMIFFSDGVNKDYFGYELNATDTTGTGGVTPDPEPTLPVLAPAAAPELEPFSHVAAMLDLLPEYARQEAN